PDVGLGFTGGHLVLLPERPPGDLRRHLVETVRDVDQELDPVAAIRDHRQGVEGAGQLVWNTWCAHPSASAFDGNPDQVPPFGPAPIIVADVLVAQEM